MVGMRGERVPSSPRNYSDVGVTELALDKYASNKPRVPRPPADSGMTSEMNIVTDLPSSSSAGTTLERSGSLGVGSRSHHIARSEPIFTPENPRSVGGVASVSSPNRASTQEELELAVSMEYGVSEVEYETI